MPIHVAGGYYCEYCTSPPWDQSFGSGGRAASAIAALQTPTVFHTYVSTQCEPQLDMLATIFPMGLQKHHIERGVAFEYLHDLAKPRILNRPAQLEPPIRVTETNVIRFGMLEGEAIIDAEWAVYDPQNQGSPTPFAENGSRARHLALVLNEWEAQQMAQLAVGTAQECAQRIAQDQQAEVVIIKRGSQGALVWAAGQASHVPAYRTKNVWKIGSGDCFVAYFAQAWMEQKLSPANAADFASRATAYYCETQGFPSAQQVRDFSPTAVQPAPGQSQRRIYLAGPFFYLAQIWMIEEARAQLANAGLSVFSPFHDVGLGSARDVVQKDIDAIRQCDVMFAIADGLDPGTIFEIGYARSIDLPVVIYSEVEVGSESLKMMEGTGCEIYSNFATAVYATLWKAVEL